jgi:hypothetical protein
MFCHSEPKNRVSEWLNLRQPSGNPLDRRTSFGESFLIKSSNLEINMLQLVEHRPGRVE